MWKWKLEPHVTRKFAIASKLRNSFPLLSKCSYSSLLSKILTTLFLISHLWCKVYIVSIHTNNHFVQFWGGIFLRNHWFYYYCLVSCNCYLFTTSLLCLVAAAVLISLFLCACTNYTDAFSFYFKTLSFYTFVLKLSFFLCVFLLSVRTWFACCISEFTQVKEILEFKTKSKTQEQNLTNLIKYILFFFSLSRSLSFSLPLPFAHTHFTYTF